MQFEIYKSEPHWIPIRKKTTNGRPLKSASPYEKTNSPAPLARWQIKKKEIKGILF